MVTCELMGGLGNQLFQIATTTALALRNNDTACFDIDGHRIGLQGRNASEYLTNVYSKILNKKIESSNVFNENGFDYREIEYKENLKIVGYFQSEKYFSDYKKEINELFQPNEDIKTYILQKYGNILDKNTCSIHIRHGDYLMFPNHHPPCSINYYNKAMEYFDNTLFLIFSDDINWCKTIFKGDNFIFIENELDYIDLYIMSMCKNNIMANSSFSWWGSWLNNNENKKIIVPSKWFGIAYSDMKTDDLYTNKMIKI
jgi:hypothetical protein